MAEPSYDVVIPAEPVTELIVYGGETGPIGPPGPQGPPGPTGATGAPGGTVLDADDKIVWNGDTELGRGSEGVLETADTFKAQALQLGVQSLRKTFQLGFTGGTANQKMDIFWTSGAFVAIEVLATGTYSSGNSTGAIKAVYGWAGNATGSTIYTNTLRILAADGAIADQFALMPIRWDAANSRWTLPIAHLTNTANTIGLELTFVGSQSTYTELIRQSIGHSNEYVDPTPVTPNTVSYSLSAADKIVWAGDTNLYRGSADELKTDDNLSVGGYIRHSTYSYRKAFQLNFSTAANEKRDIYWTGGASFTIEVTATGFIDSANANGVIKAVYGIAASSDGGTVWTNTMQVLVANGPIADHFAFMPIRYDSTNSRWTLPIAHLTSTTNRITFEVAFFGGWAADMTSMVSSLNASAIYTTDVSVPVKNAVGTAAARVTTNAAASYSVLATDDQIINTAANAVITLPACTTSAGQGGTTGRKYMIKNTAATATIVKSTGGSIDGIAAATGTGLGRYESITVFSDGTNWQVTAHEFVHSRYTAPAGQTYGTGTFQRINCTTVALNSGHFTTTTPSGGVEFTCACPGRYEVTTSIRLGTGAIGDRVIMIADASVTPANVLALTGGSFPAAIWMGNAVGEGSFAVGDKFSVFVWTNSGGTLTADAAYGPPWVNIRRVGI